MINFIVMTVITDEDVVFKHTTSPEEIASYKGKSLLDNIYKSLCLRVKESEQGGQRCGISTLEFATDVASGLKKEMDILSGTMADGEPSTQNAR